MSEQVNVDNYEWPNEIYILYNKIKNHVVPYSRLFKTFNSQIVICKTFHGRGKNSY